MAPHQHLHPDQLSPWAKERLSHLGDESGSPGLKYASLLGVNLRMEFGVFFVFCFKKPNEYFAGLLSVPLREWGPRSQPVWGHDLPLVLPLLWQVSYGLLRDSVSSSVRGTTGMTHLTGLSEGSSELGLKRAARIQ